MEKEVMGKTIEDKIDDIHDAVIRFEAVRTEVECIRKWKDGNGVPGAKTQLYILWVAFIILGGVALRGLTH